MSASIFDFVTITLDGVRSVCPSEVAAFESHPSFPGWGQLIDYLDEDEAETWFYDYDDDIRGADEWPRLHEEFDVLWGDLCRAFQQNTRGLQLSYEFINRDRCDKYDCYPDSAQDGFLFVVEDVRESKLTEGGRMVADHIESVRYLQYE
jgi:hypothetical protein